MDDRMPGTPDGLSQRAQALSRWDDDGGRGPFVTFDECLIGELRDEALTDVELVHMRIRIIALENLMIALLVKAARSQVDLAVEMADYIMPREGFTSHPLTVSAASHMKDLVQRAAAFQRSVPKLSVDG